MSNRLGIAGMDPRTEQAFTREQYDRVVRSEATPIVAAAGNPEVAERGPARTGDPDACRKMLTNMQPHGLAKSEPVVVEAKPERTRKLSESERITGPANVTDLIRKALSSPSHIFDLERGYGGREQAALAKAAAAKPREVTASTLDSASPTLRKALGEFDAIVRRAVERGLRPLAKAA